MAKTKQGKNEKITTKDDSEFKAPVIKKAASSIITIRDGKPCSVSFDERGVEISAKAVK